MIAIDDNRGILGDSILGQRALNLGDQKGIVSAVGRGLVMVMPLKAGALVVCRDRARFCCFALLGPNLTGGIWLTANAPATAATKTKLPHFGAERILNIMPFFRIDEGNDSSVTWSHRCRLAMMAAGGVFTSASRLGSR